MIALACASCRPPSQKRHRETASVVSTGRQGGGGETHGQGSLALTVRGHGCGCGSGCGSGCGCWCGWSPVSHCWRRRPWDEASTGSRGSSVAAAPHSLEQRICSNTAVDGTKSPSGTVGKMPLFGLCGSLLCKQTFTDSIFCFFFSFLVNVKF